MSNLPLEINQEIASLFGFEYLEAGYHQLQSSAQELQIQWLWSASISYFHAQGKFYTLVVKSQDWLRDIVYVPELMQESDESQLFLGSKPFTYVNLDNWDDPVVQALKNVDLITPDQHIGIGTHSYRFSIYTETHTGTTATYGASGGDNETQRKLWGALRKTVYHCVDLYDIPELTDYVARKRGRE